jgi:hypothetical protein
MALHIDTYIVLSWTAADATTTKTATLTPGGGHTPVGLMAFSTHDSAPADYTGWSPLVIDYGGVSLGSIRSQGAQAPFVTDEWVIGGKSTVAARTNNTVTVAPSGSTLPKGVLVALVYSDIGADAAYDSATAGGNTAPDTLRTGVVTFSKPLAAGWLAMGEFAQEAASNGSSGLASGNAFLTSLPLTSPNVVDFTFVDSTAAASSVITGYPTAPSSPWDQASAVLSEFQQVDADARTTTNWTSGASAFSAVAA